MNLANEAHEKFTEALSAEGGSTAHLATGIIICLGMIAATAALARTQPQPAPPAAEPSRKPAVRVMWPPIFSVTTLASLQVWNAPSSPTRTRALGLWSTPQASNATLMSLRLRSSVGQIAAAMATAGLTTAYARVAANVDEKAAQLVAPAGFAGLAPSPPGPPRTGQVPSDRKARTS